MWPHSRVRPTVTILIAAGGLLTVGGQGFAQVSQFDVDEVLTAAMDAMGGEAALSEIESIHALAYCLSPTETYVTEIRSARGDRLWFRDSRSGREDVVAVINGKAAWIVPPSGEIEPLDERRVAMLRGHEFQMIAIAMTDRYDSLAVEGTEMFNDTACVKVRLVDELGHPGHAFFDAASRLPAGLVITNPLGQPGETVTIHFVEWRRVDGVRLPSKVRTSDRSGDYHLNFREVSVNTVEAEIFRIPAEIQSLQD